MALVIEDGTNVAGANSFVTVVELRAFAEPRGITVPAADVDAEVLLIKATDYLNSIEAQFQGRRYYYSNGQPLCFPRDGVYIFDRYIGNEIPTDLKNGQCQLAIDAESNNLQAPGTGREIIEDKIGPLNTKYNPTGNTSPQYQPTAALAFLKPLFMPSSGINLLSYR